MVLMKIPVLVPQAWLDKKDARMCRADEEDDAQSPDPVQDKRQHRAFALIAQGFHQADIPFQTHPRLLKPVRQCQPTPWDQSPQNPSIPPRRTSPRNDFNTVYYPIPVWLVKSDNTHGLFVPLLMYGRQEEEGRNGCPQGALAGIFCHRWEERVLALEDAVALEMSTNTYLFYDTLVPHVH